MKLEKWKPTLLAMFFFILIVVPLMGCEEEKKPIFHYKVYQEKADGSYVLWTMKDKPKFDEGFVYWDREDGNTVYVTGNVTVETFKVGEK